MTDYFDEFDADYRQQTWGGTTKAAPILSKPGAALGSYFDGLKTRPFAPKSMLSEAYQSLSAPVRGLGGRSQQPRGGGVGAFQPAGPPQRFSVNLLGEAVSGLAGTGLGQAFLGTPGEQRGGTMHGIATTPVNFQNFATYAREGTLSLVTSVLGHKYQQPNQPYMQPAGPSNQQTILENIAELDLEGVLDNVIDGASAVGDVVNAPLVAFSNFMRSNAAQSRGEAIRDLVRSGGTIGDPVVRLSSLFDQSRFDWTAIAAKAVEQGVSTADMAAELWDLDPVIVQQIMANPDMDDEQLNKLVEGQPFSYDPGINLIAELGVTLAPMLAGAWAFRAAATGLRGVALAGRLAQGQSLEALGLLGRPIAAAERFGAWSLPKAWRVWSSRPVQAAGLVTGFTPKGLYVGAGIRFGEWALKQAASLGGHDEAVAMLDNWLWETPLSNNPGLMLVDAFAVHPLAIAKQVKGSVGARLSGKADPLPITERTAIQLGSIRDMPVSTLHERLGKRLGWELTDVERLFDPDGPLKLTEIDLKNGLVYIAQQVVRERRKARASRLEVGGGIVERNEAFWREYGEEAVKLLQDELTGKGHAIADAITDEFWHRAEIIEASDLGREGGIGPYDGTIALQRFVSWIRFNKLVRDLDDGVSAGLRSDVNLEFVAEFRKQLAKSYRPGDFVGARDLNLLQTYVPVLARAEGGLLRGRPSVPRITRKRLEALLDSAEAQAQRQELAGIGPRTQRVPAIKPADVGNAKAHALAFKLRTDTIRALEEALELGTTDGLGPLPADLAAILGDVYRTTEAQLRRDPAAAWTRALEWYAGMRESAVQRGVALESLEAFSRHLDTRFGGREGGAVDAEAMRRIADAISQPYSEAELAANPMLRTIAAERDLALSQLVDGVTAWLESPLRKLRVRSIDNGRLVLETDGFGPGDVALLESVTAAALRDGSITLPGELAALLGADVHPLEKLPAIRAALDAGLEIPGPQRHRLGELGEFVDTYAPLFDEAYGPDAPPVTTETVAKLAQEVANHADEFVGLREQARGLAGMIDRGPGQRISDELGEFYARAADLGSMRVGVGKVEVPHWQNLPIEPAGVVKAVDDAARAQRIRAIDARLASREAVLAQYDALARRATTLVGKEIAAADYVWSPEPVSRHPTKKAALAAAKELQAAGIASKIERRGSRWWLLRGELTPEAAARAEAPVARSTPATEPPTTEGLTPEDLAALRDEVMARRAQMAAEAQPSPRAAPARFETDARGNAKLPARFKSEEGYLYRVVTDETLEAPLEPGTFFSAERPDTIYVRDPATSAVVRIRDDGTFEGATGGVNAERNRRAGRDIGPDELEYLGADGAWHPVRQQPPVSEGGPPVTEPAAAPEPQPEPPSAPEAPAPVSEPSVHPPEAVAALERAREARRRYDAEQGKRGDPERQKVAAAEWHAAEAEMNAALEAVPLPAFPRTPFDLDPSMPRTSEYISHPDAATLAKRILLTPEADRPKFLFTFDTMTRIVGWTDKGEPIVEAYSGKGSVRGPETEIPGRWRPATAADFERFSHSSRFGESIYSQYAAEWEAARAAREAPAIDRLRADLDRLNERVASLAALGDAFEWPKRDGRGSVIVSADGRPGSAGWRITMLDPELGPTGHMEFTTKAEAIREARILADIFTDPTIPEPPAPPPIVEQISELEASRAAAADAFVEAEDVRAAAFREHAARYAGVRREPAPPAEPVLGYVPGPPTFKGKAVAIGDAITINGTKYRVRVIDPSGVVDVAVAGPSWKRAKKLERIHGSETFEWREEGGLFHLTDKPTPAPEAAPRVAGPLNEADLPPESRAVLDELFPPEQQSFGEGGAAPASPREVTFLDPADNRTPVRSRVVLVDADDVLTSDQLGFPANLQPRSRAVRASSDAQIQSYAADLQPDKLFGVDEGATGMPVVTPEGAVLAGNGRTAAIRLAPAAQYSRYRVRLQAELGRYGFDEGAIAGMKRPMLVRELVDVDPVAQTRLAWQLNEMPMGDLAPSLASAITREDVRLLKIADEQPLADALRVPANATAVARILDHLPADARSRYFDPKTGVNDLGARLVEGALLSKLLRADDRTLPTFEAARSVVFDVVEQGGEDMRRITNGVAEAAGQLLRAQERAEAGLVGPEILAFSDDLTPALSRILSLRQSGLNMDGVVTMLDNVTMFDEGSITPIQTHLAKVLASSGSQREVRTFLRAIAKAADPLDEGVVPMFEDIRLDYTGILNDGMTRWNAIRKEAGKTELDPFPSTEPPYDTPLAPGRVNADGTSTPPVVKSQPLAIEEVGAEIAARTAGERVVASADRIDDLPDGEFVQLTDPNEQALAASIIADPEAAILDISDAIETARLYDRDIPAYYASLLEQANAGTIRPGDWFVLRELAGGLIRRNAQGRLNMALVAHVDPAMGPFATMQAKVMPLVDKVRGRALDPDPNAALVHRPQPQAPISRAELEADVGPDVPFDLDDPLSAAIGDGSRHVVTTNEQPVLERAIRRKVGAPSTSDGKRSVIEFNAPDAVTQAERLSALRQQALAETQALRAERAAAELEGPQATEVSSVFPDDALREKWNRLMVSGVDPIAAGIGPVEPTGLSQLADAVESIDRGMYKDPVTGVGLEAAEAAELRSYLIRVMNGTIETALARRGGRAAERFTARVKPPDDFDAGELTDRAKLVIDELAQRVRTADSPLEGFEGTQYIPTPPPTKSKAAPGTPLAPRLLFRDRFAGDVIPGLLEELSVGRMETFNRRVSTARVTRALDHIVGARPEKEIRARAIANFKAELTRYLDPDLADADALGRIDKLVDAAFVAWRDHIESVKLGGYQLYRRIHLMGPEKMDALFEEALDSVYGKTRPQWYDAMRAEGKSANALWRRADNRIRNFLAQSDLPLSTALERLYGKVADLGERPGRYTTVIYHVTRFLGDTRWLALEAVEPMLLTLPQGGLKPVLEAHGLTRPGGPMRRGAPAPREPLGFGGEAQRAAFRDYAHWATLLSDTAQSGGVRQRYLVRELARQQRRPFERILFDMAAKEPELVKLIRENGDTPQTFLRRLDRDWQLAEQGTRRFETKAEAERFFRPWLDAGFIDDATYAEYVKARRYTAHPAIEAEITRVVGDPVATALYDRLAALNHELFHNLTATFFGQENRSNLQRAINHPFLYWPISYQIKATKWLLRFMLEESFGIDTGAAAGAVVQRVWDEHRRRIQADERYRENLQANATLFFIATMLLPITPGDIGVSMSPWLRMMTDENYRRQSGIFGWGPFYTYASLLPRLVAEQRKPGMPLEGELGERLQQAFPQSIVIGRPKPPTSTIDVENERLGAGQVPVPVGEPEYPRLP